MPSPPLTSPPSFAPAISGTTSTTTFTKNSDKDLYVAVDKTVYVWNIGDLDQNWWSWGTAQIELLVSVCRLHGFRRAIVFIGSIEWDWEQHFRVKKIPHEEKFVMLFGALREAHVVPYVAFYLNDAPNNLTASERAADVVSAVHNFNVAHPNSAVAGIEGDQEPTNIDDDYLSMNAAMQTRRDAINTKLELAVSLKPGWLRRQYSGVPMVDVALRNVDAGMIMAYSRDPQLSTRWGDQALALASSRGRRLSVAIETSPRAPDADSFWKMASGTERISFLRNVVDMDAHYRAGAYAGTYHGLVIHDYEGYFEAMYGMKVTEYPANVVSALWEE
jgi:hypothetical protein